MYNMQIFRYRVETVTIKASCYGLSKKHENSIEKKFAFTRNNAKSHTKREYIDPPYPLRRESDPSARKKPIYITKFSFYIPIHTLSVFTKKKGGTLK